MADKTCVASMGVALNPLEAIIVLWRPSPPLVQSETWPGTSDLVPGHFLSAGGKSPPRGDDLLARPLIEHSFSGIR